jgi:23S rRNA pseudouridine2605 synthase
MSQPPRRSGPASGGRSGDRRGPASGARGPFPKPPAPRPKRPSTANPNAPRKPSVPLREDGREGERIAKLLARAGVASRREVERMIVEGRVKIGEDVVTTPATLLKDLRGVSVDGNPVKAVEATRLFAFHKPPGLITAERDPAGRPTIYTALRNALPPDAGRLMPVGRLDFNTEGLLLLTNDGEFKRLLELPATKIPRTYRARAFGTVTQAQLEELIEGVEIEGMHYGRIDANMERKTGRNQWIEMTLTEGKNREVRRVLEHLGLEVSRLIRIGYGPFALDELAKGAAVEIAPKLIEQFRQQLGSR